MFFRPRAGAASVPRRASALLPRGCSAASCGVGMAGVLLHEAFVDAAIELGGNAGVAPPVGGGGAQLFLLVLCVGR